MEGLELVVVIGATLVFGGAIAGRIRVPTSLVLLVLGAVIGFLPFLADVELEPEVVLLLFLPALLYWESLNTSLREIKRNLRVILLQGIVLVIITAGVVAWVGQALGLPWPIALALGAILAPTDATAVAAVAGRLPRRALTTLRAESLINDGTALVIYAIAVGAAVSGTAIDLGGAALQFTASYVFGILIGLAVAAVIIVVRRIITERLVTSTLSVLTPFLAYLPAEAFDVSGVVAVVVCGLTLSWFAPRIITASQRSQSFGFWQVTTYILNGALFVLIGFELHHVVDESRRRLGRDHRRRPAHLGGRRRHAAGLGEHDPLRHPARRPTPEAAGAARGVAAAVPPRVGGIPRRGLARGRPRAAHADRRGRTRCRGASS